MKSFFLLVLSLMLTGCETMSEVRGCPEGWVEFTCKYPKLYGGYNGTAVVDPRGTPIQSTQRDVWETKGNISLYHDAKNKKLKVAIRQLQHEDFGQYRCTFYQELKSLNDTEDLHLVDDRDSCQRQFTQTAYRTAKTTITCDYQGNKNESDVMFFCKENTNSMCEDILTTKSSPKSNMTFSLTENNSSFNMSLSNVSSHHAGVYWCGVKSNNGSYRTALRKIQLEVKGGKTCDTFMFILFTHLIQVYPKQSLIGNAVCLSTDITNFTRSPTVGQNFTYWCKYTNGSQKNKFICKGEDPSICQHLVSTAQLNMTTGKFLMDEKKEGKITITVREVTTDDAGTYWCGAESTDNKRSNPFFHRLVMTVVPPTSTDESDGGPHVIVIILIVCVAVLLLLLFALIFILIYKGFAHSKNTRNGTAAQQIREDGIYEEIQEHVQRPDSGNATNVIYANFPTNPSASQHYSAIRFQNSSDKAGGEALILRPNSSTCKYSTVKYSQSPTYYEPSTSSHDPLYSRINKPR